MPKDKSHLFFFSNVTLVVHTVKLHIKCLLRTLKEYAGLTTMTKWSITLTLAALALAQMIPEWNGSFSVHQK